MIKICYLFLILLLLSCGSRNKELVIIFEESGGLQEGSDVICKNTVIGNVKNIQQIGRNEVFISISLTGTDCIPKDSKFIIHEKDLLNKALYIELGKSEQYLSKSDKIFGQITTLFYIKRRKI
nr:MlaD family protein [uncultured Fluviicola sp.]